MTIYRSWADMPTLLADLMTREWAGLVATTVGTSGAGDSLARLVDDVVATIRALRENELFVRIVELDPELVLPYLLSRRGRSQDLILALLADAIRAAQRAGDARDGDPLAMARATVLAAHGFVLSAHTMVDAAVSSDALDDELRILLTRGLS
jgi:AcrR family transcriptional regulator